LQDVTWLPRSVILISVLKFVALAEQGSTKLGERGAAPRVFLFCLVSGRISLKRRKYLTLVLVFQLYFWHALVEKDDPSEAELSLLVPCFLASLMILPCSVSPKSLIILHSACFFLLVNIILLSSLPSQTISFS